jgi:8-oxo-dGTP pyrophosphatase MutT (NUDIX family)
MLKPAARSQRLLTDIAHARPSSTVVLARATDREPEVFLVQRHEASSFGAAYAFPGGVVDPEDGAVHDYCKGLSTREADANLGVKGDGLDYYSAAVRELFEESGVLLANPDEVAEGPEAARDALNDNSDNWADFVSRNELELYCDQLHYIGHWVTPPQQPKRYSTRFFLAVMPQSQVASHCGGELTNSCWMTAHDALAAGREGAIKLHFPTIKTLETIEKQKTLDALVDWASSCVQWGVTSMVPVIIERDGRQEIVLPGDKDYPGIDS